MIGFNTEVVTKWGLYVLTTFNSKFVQIWSKYCYGTEWGFGVYFSVQGLDPCTYKPGLKITLPIKKEDAN